MGSRRLSHVVLRQIRQSIAGADNDCTHLQVRVVFFIFKSDTTILPNLQFIHISYVISNISRLQSVSHRPYFRYEPLCFIRSVSFHLCRDPWLLICTTPVRYPQCSLFRLTEVCLLSTHSDSYLTMY